MKEWDADRWLNLDEAEAFFESRQKWSFETFGPPSQRDGRGPLAHLAEKEIPEVQAELSSLETAWPSEHARIRQKLLEELVDCRFLLEDIISREGFTYYEYMDMCWKKLEKNQKRKWNKPSPDGIVEHIRE